MHIAVLYPRQLCPCPFEFDTLIQLDWHGDCFWPRHSQFLGIVSQAFWVEGDGVSTFISLPLFIHWAFQSLQWCLAHYLCHSIHYTCSEYSLHLWWLSRTHIAPVTHRQWTTTQRTTKYPLLFPFVPGMEANVPWIIYTSTLGWRVGTQTESGAYEQAWCTERSLEWVDLVF